MFLAPVSMFRPKLPTTLLPHQSANPQQWPESSSKKPWQRLAFGHLIPFLELSRRLAARGHAVTFVSTPRNVARLPPAPEGLSGQVRTVDLPLPAVDRLPDGAGPTADVPSEEVELLKAAFYSLAAPFAEFLSATCALKCRALILFNFELNNLRTLLSCEEVMAHYHPQHASLARKPK